MADVQYHALCFINMEKSIIAHMLQVQLTT